MSPTNTDRIEKTMVLRAPRERVWQTITDTGEFGRLFNFELAGSFAPGALIKGRLTLEGYEGVTFELTVERMEPGRLFSWRWHPGGVERDVDYSAEPTTLVVLALEDHPEGTLLSVVESGFDQVPLPRRTTAFRDNDQGWAEVLRLMERRVGTAV